MFFTANSYLHLHKYPRTTYTEWCDGKSTLIQLANDNFYRECDVESTPIQVFSNYIYGECYVEFTCTKISQD